MNGKERIQMNVRLDGHNDLYEAVKLEAARQDTSVNTFVINALKVALGWEDTESPPYSPTPPLEAILEALAPRLDKLVEQKVNERLNNVGELAA